MVKLLLGVVSFVVLLGTTGTWFAVTTDRWPWDERSQPASTVWALNHALGMFLFDHGQDPPQPAPRREVITKLEQAEAQKLIANDPRLKDRIVTWAGGGIQLKPAFAPRRG